MRENYKKNLSTSKKANPKIPDDVKHQNIDSLFEKLESQTPASIEAKRLKAEREKFQLLNGRVTSEYEEKKKFQDLISEVPIQREPKFAEFFEALGNLAGWSETQKKAWRKPRLAAVTINETIYSRFDLDVIRHIHKQNPYFKWCIRKFKNYAFLGEEGVLLLEKYIFQAVVEMRNSVDLSDFRARLGAKYGVPYQIPMF